VLGRGDQGSDVFHAAIVESPARCHNWEKK